MEERVYFAILPSILNDLYIHTMIFKKKKKKKNYFFLLNFLNFRCILVGLSLIK